MLLDTDVLVDVARDHPPAVRWFSSLEVFPAISGVAALELAFGCTNAADLRLIRTFLAPLPAVWPTDDDVRRALSLADLHLSHGLDLLDALTAALAVRCEAPLATFNIKHFAGVPGLTTVQPYDR